MPAQLTELTRLAKEVGALLEQHGVLLATAESCTGGWVAEAITRVPGSSAWFERGFITYSDAAKQDMLGVSAATLAAFGAVSEEVVREMANGALKHSRAQVSIAVSGIAGPGGGTPAKPVGSVCLAWAGSGRRLRSQVVRFSGGRNEVRRQAVITALCGLMEFLNAPMA
ncbi:MAG TPA: nicotinamide-nucleotide amidohydrolase family protein [Gammaproteobacteria bacterium]|nr:nicotinamide-nucleotide amidohydrolase family protein [Gammaproteobacteria bacterium]